MGGCSFLETDSTIEFKTYPKVGKMYSNTTALDWEGL